MPYTHRSNCTAWVCWPFWALLAGLLVAHSTTAKEPDKDSKSTTPFQVRKELDLSYNEGPDSDPVKHKLDLYLPKDQKDFPVVFFVHGGAWRHGDKSGHLGAYAGLASFFARHGV